MCRQIEVEEKEVNPTVTSHSRNDLTESVTQSSKSEFVDNSGSVHGIKSTLLKQWGKWARIKLETMLSRHIYLKDRKSFKKRYRLALWYLIIKEAQKHNEIPSVTVGELARHLSLNDETLRRWLRGKHRPELFKTLAAHDKARHKQEIKLSKQALQLRIDPTTVYKNFKPTHAAKPQISKSLASAIAQLLQTTPISSRIVFAELSPYHERGPRWLRKIARTINLHRNAIEQLLNEILHTDNNLHTHYHIGVVNNILYVWRKRLDPKEWIIIDKDALYYFKTKQGKQHLIRAACRYLALETDLSLSRLVKQFLENLDSYETIEDIRSRNQHVRANVLQFLLDATNQTFSNISSQLSRIGAYSRQELGGIRKPQFPSIEPLRTRLFAIMICDGHLSKDLSLQYVEKEYERRSLVKSYIKKMGDVYVREEAHNNNVYLHITKVVGSRLREWGMPVGDKALQDIRLPDFIINGCKRIKRIYFEEIIPEDGTFRTNRSGKRTFTGVFSWSRARALAAGIKRERYDFQTLIGKQHIELIIKFGEHKEQIIYNGYSMGIIRLLFGKLRRLRKSKNATFSRLACDLERIILDNPCRLLEDEKQLAISLGIGIGTTPTQICFFKKSGRVTVQWMAYTKRIRDALRFGLIAPPAHKRKNKLFRKWLQARPKQEVQKVITQLKEEGFDI